MSLLDDTSRCPLGDQCGSCSGADDLAVVTVEFQVGVYCTTLCADCVDAGRLPRPRFWAEAFDLVAAHGTHLGLDLDQTGAILETERRRP